MIILRQKEFINLKIDDDPDRVLRKATYIAKKNSGSKLDASKVYINNFNNLRKTFKKKGIDINSKSKIDTSGKSYPRYNPGNSINQGIKYDLLPNPPRSISRLIKR